MNTRNTTNLEPPFLNTRALKRHGRNGRIKAGTGNLTLPPTPAKFLSYELSRRPPLPPLERFFCFSDHSPDQKKHSPDIPPHGEATGRTKSEPNRGRKRATLGQGRGEISRKPRKRHHHTAGEGATPTAHHKETPKEKEKEKQQQKIISKIIFQTKIFLWYN